MITQADARMRAAGLALYSVLTIPRDVGIDPEVYAELEVIEQWLRRRAFGGDKIAIRQVEKELGRQVKLRGGKLP